KDAALERRFQPIQVDEPSLEETTLILNGLRDRYEAPHRVKITDEAIETAVELSERYIMERFLPDKAIELIDEAGSKVRLKSYIISRNVEEIEERIEKVRNERAETDGSQDYERAASVRDSGQHLREELEQTKNDGEEKQGQEDIEKTTNASAGI